MKRTTHSWPSRGPTMEEVLITTAVAVMFTVAFFILMHYNEVPQ